MVTTGSDATIRAVIHRASWPDRVVQIGLPPRRIDVLTSISGVEFDEAWPGRVMHEADLEALGEPLR
jgi:hypothetical protein